VREVQGRKWEKTGKVNKGHPLVGENYEKHRTVPSKNSKGGEQRVKAEILAKAGTWG
jgi:hypothetical protein